MENYENILITKIGKPVLSVKSSNPFPLRGESVKLSSTSRWVTNHKYDTCADGTNLTEITKASVLGESELDVIIDTEEVVTQSVSAENTEGTKIVVKTIYPVPVQTKPYYALDVSKQIVRTDGEATVIRLSPENGYDFTRAFTLAARVYNENAIESPVHTLTEANFTLTDGMLVSGNLSFSVRGIYDIEVDYTDTLTDSVTTKRINKLITVTPALAARDQAIEFIVPNAKTAGDNVSLWQLDGSNYPAGSTIVLKEDPNLTTGYPKRLQFVNFVGTWEQPYIITIDQSTPFPLRWYSYYGIDLSGCKHIVFDGRGYQNIEKGLLLKPYSDEYSESAFSAGNGSTEIEVFETEVDGADFSGFFIKTDPNANKPQFWYPTFRLDRLLLHHNHVHDTEGEGSYLGHYNMTPYTGTNSAGATVTYRAHHLYDCRVYRCLYEKNGYDSLQFNNAENLEICYNQFRNCGMRGEKEQTSGLSLGMSGKIYGNSILQYNGPAIQFGTLGQLEIFNNVIANGNPGSMGLMLLATAEVPEQNPNSQGYNELPLNIHNNVISSETRPSLSARNTTQYRNIKFVDNFCILSKTGFFGGQATETIALWEAAAKNNQACIMPVIDWAAMDETYKFVDSSNGDFRIAKDSNLISAGEGSMFSFDMNGYKNWYDNSYPVGPYMGKYQVAGVDEKF